MTTVESVAVAGLGFSVISAAGTVLSVLMKLKISNQILTGFEELRREMSETYVRKDVYQPSAGHADGRMDRTDRRLDTLEMRRQRLA